MFQINLCHYNVSNQDCDHINRPGGSGDYLFLHFLTPMQVFTPLGPVQAGENSFLLYPPGCPQDYQALLKFTNSYIHFQWNQPVGSYFRLPENQVFYLQGHGRINDLFRDIYLEYLGRGPFQEEQLDSLMRQLLITASREYNRHGDDKINTDLFALFQKARMEILTNIEQDWSSDSMAALTNLGKSQFYHYYHLFFHASPKAELITARMEKAKNLLHSSDASVGQIARLAGFENIYHFIRLFKKHTGQTPGAYARQSVPLTKAE